ncbi:hemophore-related protein [[Mycobacterium] kokjensenii]|uniref:Hemophore-related protein n=1 Tax=[Mycobacterium] kokjensenii TaxID=3064287 RepID=A0ABM9LBV1_9MYCO|nr:hemophore-related protein [Mycolicibacter sp. MU0083]CAJ1496321.1 hemophore-related protein [Mycolicibacter sp. MU0083]
MASLSLTRFAVAAGSVAVAISAGSGFASAAPDLGPIINTTCTYSQVTRALNAENPAAAAEFDANPNAQGMLQMFLSAPPAKRQQLAGMVQAMPEAQQYVGTITQVAGSCNNY